VETIKGISRIEKEAGKLNSVAIISDGSAVMGIGDTGPEAELSVLTEKALIFKSLAGIDAYPIFLKTQSDDELISAIKSMEPTFAGVNLEDIAYPSCLYIERRLNDILNIPVFHDDMHGTPIVILAGLINAFKITMRDYSKVKIAVNGTGTVGEAVAKLLRNYGIGEVAMCNKQDATYNGGWDIREAIRDCDVLIDLSGADMLSSDDFCKMAPESIIFSISSPRTEIIPHLARRCNARIISTCCPDYPNYIDNRLVFPGFFLGLLAARCTKITDEMKIAAADALSGTIKISDLKDDAIFPDVFDRRVVQSVALSVALMAIRSGAAGENVEIIDVSKRIDERISEL